MTLSRLLIYLLCTVQGSAFSSRLNTLRTNGGWAPIAICVFYICICIMFVYMCMYNVCVYVYV